MSKTITAQEVSHIASLARLQVTTEEANHYAQAMTKVMSYFEQIATIPTDGIEPLVTPTDIEVFLRSDEVTHPTTTEEIVANAPEKAGNLFTVPPVV